MRNLHITNDHILNLLVNTQGLLCDYTNSYPGKNEVGSGAKWIENWFIKRATYYLTNSKQDKAISLNDEELVENILSQQSSVVTKTFTLRSILPHYFRGFRKLNTPINLTGKLVVIDGPNSSGKTSLAEAFEWLLSGQIVRRNSGDMGDSKELENCISNQLRPEEESTWVEAELLLENNEKIKLKRVLTRDYDQTKTSKADSQLYMNDVLLLKEDEDVLLEEMLAGHPPVLMQHSLRVFVFSSPSQRRNYFERLLRLDELTYLIEKSVVGDAKLPDFTSSTGSVTWREWEELKKLSDATQGKILKKGEKLSPENPLHNLETALSEFAAHAFEIANKGLTIDETQRLISDIQKSQREQGFPLLEDLRPQKTVDQQLLNSYSSDNIRKILGEIGSLSSALLSTEEASNSISETQMIVAKALADLEKAGVSVGSDNSLTCPFCNYENIQTLTQTRISEIQSWQPIQQVAQQAKSNLAAKINEIKILIEDLISSKNGLIPNFPSDKVWEDALKGKSEQVNNAAINCKDALIETRKQTDKFDETVLDALKVLDQNPNHQIEELIKTILTNLLPLLPVVIDKAQEYLDSFKGLENEIGNQSREDPIYNLREMWLSVVQKRNDLCADFAWEKAKRNAQKELENIRTALIILREKLVDARRISFSEGMTSIWGKLRSDRYSAFSGLYIPPAKGKGLPMEIEVKAILDDGVQKKEVDALKVFSESQVNILGIAAFVTRSKMLGHRLLILDDPVQSMDEEHFKTFSSQLLPELLGMDCQLIVLTHNDTFARELSYAWSDKEVDFYTTMSIEHRRKKGCFVQEGNRRVIERLDQAEKYSDNGDLDNAWIAIRRSIERLCTLIRIKYGEPNFDHFSWRNTTTEDMLNQGVGAILDAKNFGTKRTKEILAMTAAAAHDKKLYQETDLLNSIKYIREMTVSLQIAG